MIFRWNRCVRRKYWILAVILLGCALSVAAWLSSAPNLLPSTSLHHRRYPERKSMVVVATRARKIGDDNKSSLDSESSSTSSDGIFGFFSGGSNRNKDAKEDEKNQQDENNNDNDGDDDENDNDSTGLFRSIAKKLENRKEARKIQSAAEEQERLDALLEKETQDNPFNFNVSSISSALQNVEAGLTEARDNLRQVRAVKQPLSDEEKRLEELRKRTAADRELRQKRLLAQKLADQRMVDRREQKKKDFVEREAQAKKRIELREKVREASMKGGKKVEQEVTTEETKRSNPLSVAQKFVVGMVVKQKAKEEWIVVAPKTRISPGEIVPITVAGLDLLLVASKDGSAVHCIANSCPHLGTPLEAGIMDRRPIETPESLPANDAGAGFGLQETDISKMLTQDGCEDCIVCPLHKTAFALDSGEVRGEWCPYPPVLGKVMGAVKRKATLPVFDVRTRGKNIEVRLNTPFKTDSNATS